MQPDLDPSVGGVLAFEYSVPGALATHSIHLPVVAFSATPSGAEHDYLYTGAGPVVPTESGILATVAALGARWAPYYPPIWTLRLTCVYANSGGFAVAQPVVPAAPAVVGTASPDSDLSVLVKRTFFQFSTAGARWRTWLRQMPGLTVGQTVGVGTTTGGLDARDHAWFAYISSGATAIVARDGHRFQPGGRVRQWWDHALIAPPADGPFLVSG